MLNLAAATRLGYLSGSFRTSLNRQRPIDRAILAVTVFLSGSPSGRPQTAAMKERARCGHSNSLSNRRRS